MPRNSEMTRQWMVLRDIDAAKTGISIAKLAATHGVHQRTIRRDITALCEAGFPLYDERVNGTTMWKLNARPFRILEDAGLGIVEVCALYFSRALLGTLAGAPFQDDAERALGKVVRALPQSCRKFLDAMPTVLKAKIAGRKKQDARKVKDVTDRLADAMLHHRRVSMRYDSRHSRRAASYVVDPLRISYVDGGVYLTAFVPSYGEVRNFAVERIRTLELLDERFEPRPLPVEPFANSIGAFSGPAEHVELEFAASVADHVQEREWHRSQAFERRADGSLLMTLDVSIDQPLKAWILGFGGGVRVASPAHLAREIVESIESARERYLPRGTFDMLKMGAASASPSSASRPRVLPVPWTPTPSAQAEGSRRLRQGSSS